MDGRTGSPEKDAWVIRVLGVNFPPEAPPIKDAGGLRAAAARMAGEVKRMAAASPKSAAALAPGLATLRDQMSAGDTAAAVATLRDLAARIDAAAAPEASPAPLPPPSPADAALQGWQAARAAAVAALKALLAKVDTTDHPGAKTAALRLRSVVKSLALDPATGGEAAELLGWLSSDDIIDKAEQQNGFGIVVRLREPLLRALGELKTALEARP